MQVLAAWLDMRPIIWCHPPNESRAPVQYRVQMKRCGLKAGLPDVLVFTPPRHVPSRDPYVGAAVELKAGKGRANAQQKAWLDALAHCGWACSVQVGASNAIAWLQSLGY